MDDLYKVQIGRYKSAYKTRWSFTNKVQAILYFNALNVGNGYKKRLLCNDKVVARVLT
jgi:hypothetical protein